MNKIPELSIIIVSYNVRAFLTHCLQSVYRASKNLDVEIYVVDNASVDASVEAVHAHFPDVRVIHNKKNVGFSAAINMALRKATGRYILLLNPDTVVQEDTFSTLIDFMDKNTDVGAGTCKILNPDGSFSVDARHSIPSPFTALWKLIGLNRLFPKSRVFGRYNLTFLDPDEMNEVDAISGSFMFLRKEIIDEVGFLDETFFMYCEDIDYCYRITKSGRRIVYLPDTQIIHYKGESTKKTDLDYIVNFNKSLYLFYRKHFKQRYLQIFSLIILVGVFLRGVFVFLKNFLRTYSAALIDVVLLNITILLGFYVRYEWLSAFRWPDFFNQYVWINVLATVLFFTSTFFFELYDKYKYSLIQVVKTNLLTFLILSSCTFFIKQLAFSRIVVLISAVLSTITMVLWRTLLRTRYSPGGTTFSKSIFQKKALLIGTGNQSKDILQKLRRFVMSNIEIRGIVSTDSHIKEVEIEGIPVVTSLEKLNEYIRLEKIDQLLFASHQIPYKTILNIISKTRITGVEFKMIPEQLDVIIGKSHVQDLAEYPLLDLEYKIGKKFNRIIKRIFDLFFSALFLLVTLLLWVPAFIFMEKTRMTIWDKNGKQRQILQFGTKPSERFWNKLLLLVYVFGGVFSFVGAPLVFNKTQKPTYLYQPGLTGLVQINKDKIHTHRDREIYELYYIRNQDLWLDLEIIFKTLFTKRDR